MIFLKIQKNELDDEGRNSTKPQIFIWFLPQNPLTIIQDRFLIEL
jgi:hypothetical protein